MHQVSSSVRPALHCRGCFAAVAGDQKAAPQIPGLDQAPRVAGPLLVDLYRLAVGDDRPDPFRDTRVENIVASGLRGGKQHQKMSLVTHQDSNHLQVAASVA